MANQNECRSCESTNANDAAFCRACGAALTGAPQGHGQGSHTEESEGLAWKWVFLGVLIIFGAGFGLGFTTGILLAIAGIKPSTGSMKPWRRR